MSTRTHIRVVRSGSSEEPREFSSLAVAYRELLGTRQELGHSEHLRMRTSLRNAGVAMDRHGFTWRSVGGTVAEESINWTDFTFGVELELLAPMSQGDVLDAVRRIGGSQWRVVHDGSLTGAPGYNAMEVVSPVLQGEAGLLKMVQVMDWLREHGCKVNSSCGLHVHVGVRGMRPDRVRRIAIAYLNAERHFDSIVPPSRRNNRYCQSNTSLFSRQGSAERLAAVTSISGLASQLNGGSSPVHYNPYRYYKLNFQSFVHHGTIEFRQHAGSVESAKAAAWVRLVTGFCAYAAGQPQQQVGQVVAFEQWIAAVTDEAGARYMTTRRTKFAAAQRVAA